MPGRYGVAYRPSKANPRKPWALLMATVTGSSMQIGRYPSKTEADDMARRQAEAEEHRA